MKLSSYAKWILSGEHAVVRGGKAIAFPLRNYECSVQFEEADALGIEHRNVSKEIDSPSEGKGNLAHVEDLNETFISLLKRAAQFTNTNFEEIRWKFVVTTDIRTKSGLGSSAAICTNIANIFKYFGYCNDVFSLAKHLEDYFHKKSSGLDISVAMTNRPIVFQNNKITSMLEVSFWPQLILTYSGEKSMTCKCEEMVTNIFKKDEKLALELDATMNRASDLCELGLKNGDFCLLKEGISLGNEAFRGWGLHNESLTEHLNILLSSGAAAAKPVGSGLGGYVVSLWEQGKPIKYNGTYLTLDRP
jgi:mevalonate kinase